MYSKTHPFPATIKERYLLSKPGSKRHTYHIVLDLKGSGYTYNVGDSIGVFAPNDASVVEKTLKAMKSRGDEPIQEKNSENVLSLHDFLTHKANLGQFSRKLLTEIAQRQTNLQKKDHLTQLLNDEHHNALKAYQEQHHLWDLLAEHAEVTFAPQELCMMMMPMLPRLYSIASSQHAVGDEVHLTVSHLIYNSNGLDREGVATSFLCRRAPLHHAVIPTYIQPHHGFTLPENAHTPIIMVGPGTGIAPFRAFMQQRLHAQCPGKNWLFFGEWNQAYDFFYEDFWAFIPNLTVTTAFSRDQEHKIYVQHRMLEQGQEIYQWLQLGAILYVCGDAQHMAKDVDHALHQIFEIYGSMDTTAAKQAVKQLRSNKQYLRDIY